MKTRRGFLFGVGAVGAFSVSACATSPAVSSIPIDPMAPSPPSLPTPTRPQDIGIIPPEYYSGWLLEHYTARVLAFNNYAPMNGGVAFAGASIIEGGDWASYFPDLVVRNYGISGDTTLGFERRMSQLIAARPGKVFLMVGSNDVANTAATPVDVEVNYQRILDRFAREAPQTKIYVQSLLPREARFSERVRAVNEGMKAAADAHGVAYVDLFPAFVMPDGGLDPSVTLDGIHPTPAGYTRWLTIIDPLVRAS